LEGDDGAEGTELGRKAEWAGRAWQADFRKENEKKIEIGWAARGFSAKIRSGCLRKIKIVFDFLIQGNEIQIKTFKYF
jgi:hypothetical protein